MESSIWEHLDLAGVLLTTIFGILFPALCVGAWRISVRTRHLESQHGAIKEDLEELEADFKTLAELPGDFKRLDERCMVRCNMDQEFRERNGQTKNRLRL